jgi:thiol:disulfide interchange protein DsbD
LPKRFQQEELLGYGYEGETLFLVEVTPPVTLPANAPVTLEASIRWLACSAAQCLPGDNELAIQFPLAQDSTKSDLIAKARSTIPQKMPLLKASQQGNFIEVELPKAANAFHEAIFFPESNEMIDGQFPVTLNPSSDKPDVQVVWLKEHPTATASCLKGILALQGDGARVAWDVDLPLGSESALCQVDHKGESPADRNFDPLGESEGSSAHLATAWNILLAVLFAFIGGLLLNLMPCVLPVISLKIFSFMKMAGQCRSQTMKHGLAFFAGVVASFWLLAGALLLLQSYGHAIGWGFQLQEPLFVAMLAALLLLFALNFFGLFEVGASLTSIAGQVQQVSKSRASALCSSFCSGILATAVATPCSGPFLGTAIGFAVTLPPFYALAIFTALGCGMALPYLLLAAFPGLLRFLPKPGPWMKIFKELMGFVMLSTVLWLLWVFAAQTDQLALFVLLAALLVLSLAGWIYGNYCTAMHSARSRLLGGLVVLLCGGVALAAIASVALPAELTPAQTADPQALAASDGEVWEPFSLERVKALQQEGRPVLIDFTAKWCLICQANHMVLSSQAVATKLNALKVVKMKADWTRRDPAITAALQSYGRNAVPLYLLLKGSVADKPIIMPQVLTPQIVIDHLNQL